MNEYINPYTFFLSFRKAVIPRSNKVLNENKILAFLVFIFSVFFSALIIGQIAGILVWIIFYTSEVPDSNDLTYILSILMLANIFLLGTLGFLDKILVARLTSDGKYTTFTPFVFNALYTILFCFLFFLVSMSYFSNFIPSILALLYLLKKFGKSILKSGIIPFAVFWAFLSFILYSNANMAMELISMMNRAHTGLVGNLLIILAFLFASSIVLDLALFGFKKHSK